jgi:hypothetical protein
VFSKIRTGPIEDGGLTAGFPVLKREDVRYAETNSLIPAQSAERINYVTGHLRRAKVEVVSLN